MHQIGEVGGWGGPLATGDAGGGDASSEKASHALMCLCVRNNATTEKPHMTVHEGLLLELLLPVDRSGDGDLGGMVSGRRWGCRKSLPEMGSLTVSDYERFFRKFTFF